MHTAGHRPQNYVSRCFLRCRPPAPTETIGFPVRQQSGSELLYVTNYSTKPQELTLHGVRRFLNLHTGETGGSRLTLPVLGTLLAAVER